MDYFKFEPTKTAEWQALILEAETQSGYVFDESIECYLVLTLDHYTTAEGLASSVIAIDFLKALKISGNLGIEQLRHVGDQCLLLAGLFPECARKKNVSLGYFIGIGKEAYHLVGAAPCALHLDADLFNRLSNNFVGLMDVLHTMRYLHFNKH